MNTQRREHTLPCPQHPRCRLSLTGFTAGRDNIWQGTVAGCMLKSVRLFASYRRTYEAWEPLTPDELRAVYADLRWADDVTLGLLRWMALRYQEQGPERFSIARR